MTATTEVSMNRVRADAMNRHADRLEFEGDLDLAAYCRREAESLLLEAGELEETICPDCGHTAATGACWACKAD